MTLMISSMIGFGVVSGGGSVATATFTDNTVSTTNTTAYTFSSQSLGTAASDRQILVATYGYNTGRVVSSLTVGGESAANKLRKQQSEVNIEFWTVALASGTSGDIVVTWDGAMIQCGIGVWALYGASTTPSDTSSVAVTGAGLSLAVAHTSPADGFAIGYAADSSNIVTFAWDSSFVEKFDEAVEPNANHAGAQFDGVFDDTVTVTLTAGGGSAASKALGLISYGTA
jgi:hypothetical protein